MARPHRIEFPGALYYVMSRGQRRDAIYEDDTDRELFMDILATVVKRFHWECYAYCQLTHQYQLLIRTKDATLSKAMRYLNGVYTQASNRRHDRDGHVFQGRYKAVLVDPKAYLLEVARYVVLNPVRAGLAEGPQDWHWSSYRATAGLTQSPEWLATDELLARFAGEPQEQRQRYREYVLNGVDIRGLWHHVRRQVYLGDDDFMEHVQRTVADMEDSSHKGARAHPAPSLDELAARARTRNDAIVDAYKTGFYSYAEIGRFFGLHPTSVGRIIRPRL